MPEPTENQLTRRDLLEGAAASVLLASAGSAVTADAAVPNLIPDENRKTGSLDWQLTRVRLDKPTGYRSPWIEGYCSQQSVEAGDTLQFMVSTAPPARFQVEIFRTGYYGG